MTLAGILTASQGYPVDDDQAMFGIIAYLVPRTCSLEGVPPQGTLTVKRAETARINGQPLFDDEDVAIRWELEVS